jgi:hypothetical protein
MYGYGYRYNSGLVVGAGGGGGGFTNTYSTSFDGVDDYVDLGDNFNSVFTGTAWSFSAWIKVSANTSYDCFFSKDISVQFYIHSNKVKIYLGYPYLTNIKPLVSATTILVDTWYHIAFTRSGNDNVLYINGSSDATATSVGSMSTSTTESVIGAFTTAASYPFQGNIDEVCIFDRVVTPTEIVTLSTAPTVDLSSLNPISWWRMGDGVTAFPTIPDVIGTNDGTAYNENEATMVVPDVPL